MEIPIESILALRDSAKAFVLATAQARKGHNYWGNAYTKQTELEVEIARFDHILDEHKDKENDK